MAHSASVDAPIVGKGMLPILIQALCRPGVLGEGGDVEVVETHISWVLLTRNHAYKIKKPVNLGFVDFSTLAQRKFYCEEELRLNRRFHSGLYVDVISIHGNESHPVIDDCNNDVAIEFAVKMRRFPADREMRCYVRENELGDSMLANLAHTLAEFHRDAAIAAPDSPYARNSDLAGRALDNFHQIAELVKQPRLTQRLSDMKRWTEESLAGLSETFRARKSAGRVRECHGDLHLGNMVVLDQEIVPFDCLEFNADFRWIDVASELAFLLMDLQAAGLDRYARVLLNDYLDISADYEMMTVLRHYKVYRALVRAKVSCLSDSQRGLDCDAGSEFQDYLGLAEQIAYRKANARVVLTHGFSGSGKTWLSRKLMKRSDLIHIRSDIVRKQMYPARADQTASGKVSEGIYTADAMAAVYARLCEISVLIARAGYPVLVDATFLDRSRRQQFRDQCGAAGISVTILDLQAPRAVLESRIARRMERGNDASEANQSVLDYQVRTADELSKQELLNTVTVATDRQWDPDAIDRLASEIGVNKPAF